MSRAKRESLNINGELHLSCSRCERWLPINLFYNSDKSGLRHPKRSKCIDCERISRQELKTEVFLHYSKDLKCQCPKCEIKDINFLTLDHVNNDGAKHRKSLGGIKKQWTGERIYSWAKNNNYPTIFQILCYNCNLAKAKYGKCPHLMEIANEG